MALHKDLIDSELHEMKGAAGASVDTVPVSNGSGSTTFKKLTKDSLDTSSIKDTNKIYVSVLIEDTATAFEKFIPVPFDCTMTEVSGTIATAPATDLTILFYNTGSVSSFSSLSFPSAGTLPMYTSSAILSSNSFFSGDYVRITNASGVATSGAVTLVLLFTLS